MAKTLRSELAGKGLNLTHAQALELAAKTTGHRTLHVAQAQATKEPAIDLDDFALREAGRQMFTHLGIFEGRVLEVMVAIRAAFALEESRDTEHAIHELTVVGGVKLSDEMEPYRWDQLQEMFDRKVAQIKQLAFELHRSSVKQDADGREVLWRGQMQDWVLEDGEQEQDVTPRQQRKFDAVITRAGSQLVMDICLPHSHPDQLQGTDCLSLFIEVNRGVPCVHLSNDMYGDQVLTVFGTTDGLYLRPDSSMLSIRTGLPDEGTTLRAVAEEDRGPAISYLNDAFIVAPNAG